MRNLKRKLGILDVKQALYDENFQKLFPELKEDINKILSNPTCSCNREMYLKFFNYKDRLEKFFPNREVESLQENIEKVSENHWLVISCHISELESRLKKLAPTGRMQLAVARFEDQVTVIVNNLELLF